LVTEAEWLVGERPGPMFNFLRDHVRESDRKLLLFCVACCRLKMQEAPLPVQERHRRAIEMIEKHADGLATEKQMRQACDEIPSRAGPRSELVLEVGRFSSGVGARLAARALAGGGNLSPTACHLLREIFGNPFCPLILDRVWVTPAVGSIAHAGYDQRILPSGELDSVRLSILSDALEEAGCPNQEILGHLRSPGPHCRGCWALDLCLSRS
jgi:hypothetical protein